MAWLTQYGLTSHLGDKMGSNVAPAVIVQELGRRVNRENLRCLV